MNVCDTSTQASSSCDGSVRIWQCGSGKCLKMLSCLPKSNDVGASKTLARICFTPDGKVSSFVKVVRLFAQHRWRFLIIFGNAALRRLDGSSPFFAQMPTTFERLNRECSHYLTYELVLGDVMINLNLILRAFRF